jgi:transposase
MQTTQKIKQNQSDYASLSKEEMVALLMNNDAEMDEKDNAINAQKKQIECYQRQIAILEELARQDKIQRFASKSEKHALQVDLFDEAELEEDITDLFNQLTTETQDDATDAQWELRKKNRKRKRQFAPHLERVKIKHTSSDKEKVGATGTFFAKVKEELDVIPASVRVIEHWQEKPCLHKTMAAITSSRQNALYILWVSALPPHHF